MKLTPPSLSSYDQKTGRIVYEDMTALHDRQTMSLWGFTDWQWLFNLRALVKTVYKSPTIPLLSRLVSGWRIPQQLPQMPCLASWLDWLVIWVGNEFMTRESDCSFAGEDAWKKDVLASVVANRLSGVLLLGLGDFRLNFRETTPPLRDSVGEIIQFLLLDSNSLFQRIELSALVVDIVAQGFQFIAVVIISLLDTIPLCIKLAVL